MECGQNSFLKVFTCAQLVLHPHVIIRSLMARPQPSIIMRFLSEAGEISLFAMRAIRVTLQSPFELREVARQVYMAGWRSLPLVMTSGLAIGVVLSMHTRATMERFGAEALIPAALAIALVSETGSLMTGLLLSGRVAAAVGAELGGMKVTEQIDGLESPAVEELSVPGGKTLDAAMACLQYTNDRAVIGEGYAPMERLTSSSCFSEIALRTCATTL